MRNAAIPAAAALLLALSNPASAAPGFATGNVNLRAGPGTNYPQVTVVPAGAPVEIIGCLGGYSWCDVGFGQVRGWVSANYLQYLYENRRVPLPEYAPRVGLPVVTFSFGDYWGSHYRGRSWYADRDRWGGPPPRAAFREPRRDPRPGHGPEWRGGPPDRQADRRDDRHDNRGPPGQWQRGPDRGPDRGPGDRGFGDRGPDRDDRGPGDRGDRGRDDRGRDDRGRDDRGPGRGHGPG
ncbi:SH3 domain-containing protein [Roseomonas harenae]|uniref:SH3 domain-containing protein n=1 Tax=Muricoccus harenae TaxID=2692566 RepID=UPI0013318902|nr:SH3 domain-containing protein [Roseomonas harenae]